MILPLRPWPTATNKYPGKYRLSSFQKGEKIGDYRQAIVQKSARLLSTSFPVPSARQGLFVGVSNDKINHDRPQEMLNILYKLWSLVVQDNNFTKNGKVLFRAFGSSWGLDHC